MQAYLVMDGQWGSCGKGLLAGTLAMQRVPDLAVCNFGPNAGHTFITREGMRVMTRQLPTAVASVDTLLAIGPGSIIDPVVLHSEVNEFDGPFFVDRRLMIHERAAVVTPADKVTEEPLKAIASTRKGTGAAQCRKLMRHGDGPRIAKECPELKEWIVTDAQYRRELERANLVQVESAQGFELSLNHGSSYPYCTSRDVTPESLLNEVGISIRDLLDVNVVVRTYPIRVGNEFGVDGSVIGTSGPVYPDMKELTWSELSERIGKPVEERTTVTGKIRRVFTWSDTQFKHMLERFSPCNVMLNFVNYLDPTKTARSHRHLNDEAKQFIQRVEDIAYDQHCFLEWLGFGPGYRDVVTLGY